MLGVLQTSFKATQKNSPGQAPSPTNFEVLRRVLLGTPLFSGGAALAIFVASKIVPHSISPLAGAVGGASLALINIITSLAYKAIGLNVKWSSLLWSIKAVADCALTTLATVAICSAIGISLTPINAALVIPASFAGACALTLAASVLEHIIQMISYLSRSLIIQTQVEMISFGGAY